MASLGVVLALAGGGGDGGGGGGGGAGGPAASFVGSSVCGQCHDQQFAAWQDSGHPYKLTKIE